MLSLSLSVLIAANCGIERQLVKTLSDPRSHHVEWHARTSSVEELTALMPPAYNDQMPRQYIEMRAVELEAEVIGFKVEADLDWHVVIRGPSGATMVVELPDPKCAEDSETAKLIIQGRRQFLKIFTAPEKRFTRLVAPVRVAIRGVPFWDRPHGQTGGAKNGIELHPVIAIERVAER